MRFFRSNTLILTLALGLVSCGNDSVMVDKDSGEPDVQPMFRLMDSATSGLYFVNELKETEKLNILTYEYLYNGGGVAIGDINNDSLPDIFMVGNFFGGRLFLNEGHLKFRQISETANVFYGGFSTGVTMADVNSDGFLDIYICRSMSSNVSERANLLLINNGDLTFTERAAEYGLNDKGYSNHANFFDCDGDGDLDMYLVNHRIDMKNALNILDDYATARTMGLDDSLVYYSSNRLYRNNGNGKFEDVTKQAGVGDFAFSLAANVSDINGDGSLDIYLSCDYYDRDRLYINNGNGVFTDQMEKYIGHVSRNSMGCDIADFNNDALPDIITLDMMSEDNFRQKQLKGNTSYDVYQIAARNGYFHQVMRNTLQLNNGNGTFSEIGQYAGVANTDWSWAPLLADFDNDGKKDLFITNGYYRDVTDMDFLKYDSPEVRAGENSNVLAVVQKMKRHPVRNYFYLNRGDLTFVDNSDKAGLSTPSYSNGAAYADLDLDGDLDLVVNNLDAPSFFYENLTSGRSDSANSISIRLVGDKLNPTAEGVRVWLMTDGQIQMQEAHGNRGFFSYMTPLLHFGIGSHTQVDSVVISWPNGVTKSITGDLRINSVNYISISSGQPTFVPETDRVAANGSAVDVLNYVHVESDFIDFKNDPLFETMYSCKGPNVEAGDVNGDGREDIIIGGSAGQETKLFIQDASGNYVTKKCVAFEQDKSFEDGQMKLFDSDGDKDLDLFIISTDNEFLGANLRQPRLYINDGSGRFERKENAIPVCTDYSYATDVIDFDSDGDSDLIVGGYIRQGSYPTTDASYILVNSGGMFSRAELDINREYTAIVNDICVADVTGDKLPDVIMANEWGNISVYEVKNKKFVRAEDKLGLSEYTGLWSCVNAADVDNDGDIDLIAGNRGTNVFYKPRMGLDARLYYSDFDKNGKIDPIPMFPFPDGNFYAKHTLDVLFTVIPSVRKQFTRYEQFSACTGDNLIDKLGNPGAPYLSARYFESMIFMNNGKRFTAEPLTAKVQFSPVNYITVSDLTDDGIPDLLCAGNCYHTDVDNGRCDAQALTILTGDGKGHFSALKNENISGECRWVGVLNNVKYSKLVCVARNSDSLVLFLMKRSLIATK